MINIKVYASFSPVIPACYSAVEKAGATAITDETPDWLTMDDSTLSISFEGQYFPAEEVLSALSKHLSRRVQGKIDIIDMDAWTLTRCTWQQIEFRTQTRSLNHVLNFSGH